MRMKTWIAAALLFTLSLAAGANSTQVGDLHVYYNALPSTELTPEVARQYGITRSANRALLNVSVRRGEPGADVAVAGIATALASSAKADFGAFLSLQGLSPIVLSTGSNDGGFPGALGDYAA